MRQDQYALRFPVGKFKAPDLYSDSVIENWIQEIAQFPLEISNRVSKLTHGEKLLTYREGGWNVQQVVHHCADSHMNSFVRFKWALTENNPVIKPYEEAAWAELSDGNCENLEPSLLLIEGIHTRWVILLRSLSENQLNRTFIHPATNQSVSLKENIGIYAWHCRHHLGHLDLALDSRNRIL